MTKFAGQSVIITGGASGIGRALGSALSAHGAHVVLADIDGDRLAEAVSTIGRASGGSMRGVTLDVRDRAAVVAPVDSVVAEHGRLDIMIARNRAIVVVPRSGKGLWYLQRVSPAAVRGVGRLLMRRVLRKMKQE